MKLELTRKQFRRLLDMVYIGNWILNSTRGEDRIPDYDEVESLLFCVQTGIGVGIIAFGFGYLVARRKYQKPGETPRAGRAAGKAGAV